MPSSWLRSNHANGNIFRSRYTTEPAGVTLAAITSFDAVLLADTSCVAYSAARGSYRYNTHHIVPAGLDAFRYRRWEKSPSNFAGSPSAASCIGTFVEQPEYPGFHILDQARLSDCQTFLYIVPTAYYTPLSIDSLPCG